MARKYKVPKKLAGVRIPAAVRKSQLVKSLLGTDIGRQILADALVAAAGAAAAVLVAKPQVAAKAGEAVADAGSKGGNLAKEAVKSAAGAVTEVLGNAAKSILPTTDQKNSRSRKAAARSQHH